MGQGTSVSSAPAPSAARTGGAQAYHPNQPHYSAAVHGQPRPSASNFAPSHHPRQQPSQASRPQQQALPPARDGSAASRAAQVSATVAAAAGASAGLPRAHSSQTLLLGDEAEMDIGASGGHFFTLTDRVRAMVDDSGPPAGAGGGSGVAGSSVGVLRGLGSLGVPSAPAEFMGLMRPSVPGVGGPSVIQGDGGGGRIDGDDGRAEAHHRRLRMVANAASGLPNSAAGANDADELVETEFRWSGGGLSVQLAGSFNGWAGKIPMRPDPTTAVPRGGSLEPVDFVVVLRLPPGLHQFKYIVDDEWALDPNLPTMQSPVAPGVINNIVQVNRRVFEEAPNFTDSDEEDEDDFGPAAADALDDFSGTGAGPEDQQYRGLFESSSGLTGDVGGLPRDERRRQAADSGPRYGQVVPPLEDYDLGKDPPKLPPHLLPLHLNSGPGADLSDPYQLPLPRHVTLNHLYVYSGASTSGTAFVSTITQRFKTRSFVSAAPKYVTTVFYAPRENMGPRLAPAASQSRVGIHGVLVDGGDDEDDDEAEEDLLLDTDNAGDDPDHDDDIGDEDEAVDLHELYGSDNDDEDDEDDDQDIQRLLDAGVEESGGVIVPSDDLH